MNIQIREFVENKIFNNFKNIETKIISDREIDPETVSWGFIVTQSPINAEVFQSGNSPEGTFLKYENSLAPQIQINLHEEGVYRLKIVCQITTVEEGLHTVVGIDNKGNVRKEQIQAMIPEYENFESSEIEIVYDILNDGNAWT